MRRYGLYISLFVALFTSSLLTSCDEDLEEAYTLAGEWYGDFGMSYDALVYGRPMTFRSYESKVVFYPHHDYATYGTGTQVDFYREGPYECMYYNFRWTIENGVIYLRYPYEDSYLNTEISDYALSYNQFKGYFGWTSTTFCLHKMSGYYDWSPYYDSYGWYYREGWYSPYYTRSGDSVGEGDTVKVMRIGSSLLPAGSQD